MPHKRGWVWSLMVVGAAMAGASAQAQERDRVTSAPRTARSAADRRGRLATGALMERVTRAAHSSGEQGFGGGWRAIPLNDDCADAFSISDGPTSFSTLGATTGGTPVSGHPECDRSRDDQINQDIWFDYVASFTGLLSVDTCGTASYDTRLAIYDGCDCPVVGDARLPACDDDNPVCGDDTAAVAVPVTIDRCYKVRLGGFAAGSGTGTVTLEPRCEAVCPGTASPEPEVCGSDANGGCNMVVPAFTPMTCGETVCGTAWGNTGLRDTDWYELMLPDETLVTWTVTSEFPSVIGFVDTITLGSGSCLDFIGLVDPSAIGGACDAVDVSQVVPPGAYWLFVATVGFDGLPCGSPAGNDYVASVTCDVIGAPENDDCAGALPISDGDTAFDTELATTDGPNHPNHPQCDVFGNDQIYNDIWYDYVASCTGELTVRLCDSGFDTKLAVYEGTGCPVSDPVACDDDACSPQSELSVLVTGGAVYKIRIGGWGPATTGSGIAAMSCAGCPNKPVDWVDPRDGTIDAGIPSNVDGGPLLGIDRIHLLGSEGVGLDCLALCEHDPGGLGDNAIISVIDNGNDEYVLHLNRPITPYAVTTVTFLGSGQTGVFTSHPANTNGDDRANVGDVLKVVDYLRGVTAPPWGIYSVDVNRSGAPDPADILSVIDLLHGAGAFPVYSDTPVPVNLLCPQ